MALEFLVEDWGILLAQAGAMGVAAQGVVEGLKVGKVGISGFERVLDALHGGPDRNELGPFGELVQAAYGPAQWEPLLEDAFRSGAGVLEEALREGFELGLDARTADKVARDLGLDAKALVAAVEAARSDEAPDLDHSALLARYLSLTELRARGIAGAAQRAFRSKMYRLSMVFALVASILAHVLANTGDLRDEPGVWLTRAFCIGLIAVPIAPITKDLVNLLQTATSLATKRL